MFTNEITTEFDFNPFVRAEFHRLLKQLVEKNGPWPQEVCKDSSCKECCPSDAATGKDSLVDDLHEQLRRKDFEIENLKKDLMVIRAAVVDYKKKINDGYSLQVKLAAYEQFLVKLSKFKMNELNMITDFLNANSTNTSQKEQV